MGSPNNIVADGDSVTLGFPALTPYTSSLTPNAGPSAILNVAVSGETLATMVTLAATHVDSNLSAGSRNVVVIWGGTNDFGASGSTVGAVYSLLQTYCAARRAAGWKVIVVTMISRTGTNPVGGETLEVDKNAYNALILANWPSFADGVADFTQTVLGPDGACANSTYFQVDQIHPTQTGITTVEAPVIQAAINAVISSGVSHSQTPPPALVQSNTGETSNPTLPLAYLSPVSAGSLLCGVFWAATGAGTGIADSLNGTWTTFTKQTNTGVDVQFGYFLNSKAGPNTVTFTTTTRTIFGNILEFSGVSAFDTFVQSLVTNQNPTENITTAKSGELLVGWVGCPTANFGSIAAGTNMTAVQSNAIGNRMTTGYGIIAGAGATSLGFALNTSFTVMMGVAAFQPTVPSSGGGVGGLGLGVGLGPMSKWEMF